MCQTAMLLLTALCCCATTLSRFAAQDFTQAELLLGLRVVSNPNGLFFCGDTCQTIARGIGFRCGLRAREAHGLKDACWAGLSVHSWHAVAFVQRAICTHPQCIINSPAMPAHKYALLFPLLPRFTDVKQLFYEAQREALERKGGKGGAGVQMPDIVELQTNYRTHS